MPTNSEDVHLRCVGCGKDLDSSATIRVPQTNTGQRLLDRAKWLLSKMRCDACQAARNDRHFGTSERSQERHAQ